MVLHCYVLVMTKVFTIVSFVSAIKLLRYCWYDVEHHSVKINQSFHFRKCFNVYNLQIIPTTYIFTPCSLCFLITVDLLILLENAKLLDHGNILNNLYRVLFPAFSFLNLSAIVWILDSFNRTRMLGKCLLMRQDLSMSELLLLLWKTTC